MRKVVILGDGFGGLYAAQPFKNTVGGVTLVDRPSSISFNGFWYEAATGSLAREGGKLTQ